MHQNIGARCRTEVTEAPILRLESRAEQIADLRLICAGLAPPGTANFTVTLSVPIALPLTGVQLEVGQPPVAYTPIADGTHRVRFSNVTLPPGIDSAVRITGLRADFAGLDGTLRADPLVVRATLSAGPIAVSNPELIAGYPTPSISAALNEHTSSQPRTGTLIPSPSGSSAGTHTLTFYERFRGAFRTPWQQPISGRGTLLVAEFTNIPAGAALAVTLRDSMNDARLVESEENPVQIFASPIQTFYRLPITNGRAIAVWEVTQNTGYGVENGFSFNISATGPAIPIDLAWRYGPAQFPALPRFDPIAKPHSLDCQVNCFSTPAVMSFTRRFGQPPPVNSFLPVAFVGPSFPLEFRASPDSSQSPLTVLPSTFSASFIFDQAHFAPGRYTTIVEARPTAGGPSRHTLVVFTVTPPLPTEEPPPQCVAVPPVQAVLRAEGTKEPLPSIVIECNGGVPGTIVLASLSAKLNANFTSRNLANSSNTEALLVVSEPGDSSLLPGEYPVPARSNFPSTRPVTEFSVNFEYHVPASRRMRLQLRNLRISAASLAANINSPTPPVATIELSIGGSVTMRPTVLPLGTVQRGLDFSVHSVDGQPVARMANVGQYQLRFREGFPAAFRRRNAATTVDNPSALADQTSLDNNPATETMFYTATRGAAGLATSGTRVNARFSGIPSNARLLVTLQNLSSSTSSVRARLNTSQQGSFSAAIGNGETVVFEGIPHAVTELPMVDAWGARDATWEVLASDPSQLEELRFGVVLLSPAPIPPISALGTLYPIDPVLTPQFLDAFLIERRNCTDPACLFYRDNGGEVRFEQLASDPAVQTRTFLADTNGPSIRYLATSDRPWLTIVNAIGLAPGGVSLKTDTTGLAPGVHRATVRLNDYAIPVKLTIHPVIQPVLTIDPASSPNRRTFRITAAHATNASEITIVNLLINSALDGARGCYLAYSNPAGALFLVNDQGPDSGLSAPLILGAPGEVANRQCRIHGPTSSVTRVASLLRFTIDISFTPEFTGSKTVYAAVRTADFGSSGWSLQDAIHLPEPATFPRSLGPLTVRYFGYGYGDRTAMTFTYEEATDANNFETVWGLINTGVDARSACYFAYYVPGNLLFLYPDDGNGAAAQNMPLLGSGILSNSQCSILANGAYAEKSGRQLTLTVPFRFPNNFNAQKGVWGAAKSFNNPQASPWQILGAARLD